MLKKPPKDFDKARLFSIYNGREILSPEEIATATYRQIVGHIDKMAEGIKENGFIPRFIVFGHSEYNAICNYYGTVEKNETFPTEYNGMKIIIIPLEHMISVVTDPKNYWIGIMQKINCSYGPNT